MTSCWVQQTALEPTRTCLRGHTTHEWHPQTAPQKRLFLGNSLGIAGLFEGQQSQHPNDNARRPQPEQQLTPRGFRHYLRQHAEVIVINGRHCCHFALSVQQAHMLQVHSIQRYLRNVQMQHVQPGYNNKREVTLQMLRLGFYGNTIKMLFVVIIIIVLFIY